MEKQQADSLQKSPVPKPVTSTDTEINGQSTQVLTNGSHVDKSPKSTEKLPSATYKDGIPCKESLVDKKAIESADLDEKTKAEVKESIEGEEVPHAIISVDIQKSMPYEKYVVPQEAEKDSKGDVPPEVLASVVTTAVVNEAALTVSGTDGSIINGTKIVSDSSKVDAVVEQELSKMSDLKTDNIELQSGEESSKLILNGDIDHSPLSEDTTAEMATHLTETSTSSKEKTKAAKEVSDKKDTTYSIKLESELPKQSISETSSKLEDTSVEKRQSIDGGQVNGVPGIITVESITKREPTQMSGGEEVGSITDADMQKDNIETLTSNSVTLSADLENVKCVPGNVKETEGSKSDPESTEKLSKSDKETKAELPGVEHKVADDNLTDSAKLLLENLTDSAKLKTEITEKSKDEPLFKSESETTTEVHKTKIADAAVDKSKEETTQKSKEEKIEQEVKKEEDSSKSKDQIKNDDTLYAAKAGESKIEEKVEGAKDAKESKGLEQKSELISDKDSKEDSSATEAETSTFIEKKEIEQKDITSNEASPKKSPLPDESIKTKEICDIQTTKSPSLSPKKTKTEEEISSFITSVPISEKSGKSKGVASEPQTEKSIAEEMAESNKTSETVCDMSLMMTSQILTPELLSAEEDTESIEKTKEVSETLISEETRKDDTREKSLEQSDVTELQREESCRISAARYSPETCDVAVGLDEHRMIRVAAGDGGEEEVDGQQASAEVEVTDEALQSHTEEDAGSENIMGNGAASPSSGTPSSDRVASSAKISATPSSKPSSGISQKDDESQKGEDSKPASAVSRSSIPEPIIYEPPERRKSAASTTSEDKKDLNADKSQKDEQELEKSAEKKAEEERCEETSAEESDKKEEVKSIDSKSETIKEVVDSKAEEKVSIKDEGNDTTGEKGENDLDINKEVGKEDESKKAVETEKVTEEKTEKGVEDEKEKETIESKGEGPEAEKESGVDDIKAPTEKTEETAKETAEPQPAEISGSQSPTPSVKEDDKSNVSSEKRDEALDKPSEESGKEKSDEETKSEENIAEKEKEVSAEKSEEESKFESLEKQDKPESSEKEDSLDKEETPEVSQMEDKAEISQKEEKAEISKDETEITKKEAEAEISQKEKDKSKVSEKEDKIEVAEKESDSQLSEKEDTTEVPEKENKAEISEKEKEAEISTEEKETSEKEDRPTTPEKGSVELEAKTTVTEVPEEPKTLVQEESKVDETSEKEAGKSEEKEEDDTEKEITPDEEVRKEDKEEDQEKIATESEVKKEAETTAIEEAETVKIEETEEAAERPEKEEEKPSASTTEEAKSSEDGAEKEEPTEEEKTAEDAEKERKSEESEGEVEKGESEAEDEKKDEEKKDPEQDDEQEKQDEGKEHEEKPESPPKSPTKRMRSPDKAGRRGVSPISSPPKPLKTPPSPQKPQKSTSPKKKNGMLSPVKVPKTPGSDTRKLPPIKAPVGLAPNPNLKNIRSKIGSFDNIRYKPGGGDKKVISKKLEWKATPKIGSLDHSFKSGERKHGKSHSKGDLKDGKLADGQSPLPSGDEGEAEGATAVAETLIKPDGSGSTEMPAAITAES